ncbi:MAG: histidine phosphatase family protein [Betaproteobacteria bacterium HGW-Betaproteobacteria-8]|nr:MAG: histidine phosphatase family protein [Betaproteobacteria bacterium HGW-Betaproteobacteria-8]
MNLILWRHAEAQDTSPDIERILTPRGRKQAEKMAAWLKTQLPADTLILVSPAARTQQTAKALTEQFTTLAQLAPGTSADQLLAAAGWPKARGTVLVVAHQPALGMAAAKALTGKTDYWSVKKGAIWWLTNRVRGDERQTVLRAVLSPDMLDTI